MSNASSRLAGFLTPALLVICLGAPARASFVYVTPAGSTTGGGAVSATATITVNNGSFTVVLTNLGQNPTADSQLLSGYVATITGATGTGTLASTNSGNISEISSGGSYTAGTADPLTRWKATGAGTTISQNIFSGGTPTHLIIGPDSAGGFSNAGLYSNANPSITKVHNPSVLGTATFTVTDAGVTTASLVTSFIFRFGTTDPATDLVTAQLQTSAAVPEPASILSAGVGLLCVAGAAFRRSRRAPVA